VNKKETSGMIKRAAILVLLVLTSACGTSHRMKAAEINAYMETGDYKSIIKKTTGTSIGEKIKTDKLDTLDSLNAGNALFFTEKYKTSINIFDNADIKIDDYFREAFIKSSAREAAAAINNASIFDYEPMVMDNIYLSSYKILSYLALNDTEGARIEVNKAYTKQQSAAEYFGKQIEKANNDAQSQLNDLDTKNQTLWNNNKDGAINKNFADLKKWSGYQDYMNPYTTYLSGLYFIISGQNRSDYENAATYMKRVAGMVPLNSFVIKDLIQAENLANFKPTGKEKNVWIIYENGMVADFEEIRIDIPAFLFSNNLSFISFSMPKPKLRSQAFQNIIINSDGSPGIKTEILADVDSMFIAEYNRKLPALIGRAAAQAITKAIMQYTAYNNDETGLAGLAATIYNLSTSPADIRSWHTLPKNVQIAKIKNNKSDTLNIYTSEMVFLEQIKVQPDRNTIVYIRIPSIMSKPVISVITL
jgi:hypothetical protein